MFLGFGKTVKGVSRFFFARAIIVKKIDHHARLRKNNRRHNCLCPCRGARARRRVRALQCAVRFDSASRVVVVAVVYATRCAGQVDK